MRLNRKLMGMAFSFIVFMSIIANISPAAATSRKELLGEFLLKNETTIGAYKDANSSSVESATAFTTYVNVYMLDTMGILNDTKKAQTKGWIEGEMEESIIDENITNFYYALATYLLLGGELNQTERESKAKFIKDLQNSTNHGFASGGYPFPSLYETYFAIKSLNLLGFLGNDTYGVVQANIHQYVMDYWDNVIGGFVIPGLSRVSIPDTYYAVGILEEIGAMDLSEGQIDNISAVINDLYVSDSTYKLHYGGFSLIKNPPQSSVLLTYYCVHIASILNIQLPDAQTTLEWLLSRQSPVDYGFSEVNDFESNKASTATTSYFAFTSILLLEPDALEKDGVMMEEEWDLKVSSGTIAAIVVGSVGGVLIVAALIWKWRSKYKI